MSRFVSVCLQNATAILIHDVTQLVSNVRMNEIEHHVAIHFQSHQERLNILEDFRACVDESTERRSKKEKFRKISEFQRVVVYFLEQTQRHARELSLNFRIFEIVSLQKVRASFRREHKEFDEELRIWQIKIRVRDDVRKKHVAKKKILRIEHEKHDEHKEVWEKEQRTLSDETDIQRHLHSLNVQSTTKIRLICLQILILCRFRSRLSSLRQIVVFVVVYVDEIEIVVNVEVVWILDLIFEMFKRKNDFATRFDEFSRERTFRDEAKACIKLVNSSTTLYFESDSLERCKRLELESITVTILLDDDDIVFVWSESEFDVHYCDDEKNNEIES